MRLMNNNTTNGGGESTFRFKVGDKVSFLSTAIPQYLLEFQGISFNWEEIEEGEYNGTIRDCYTFGHFGNCYSIITNFGMLDRCVPEEKISILSISTENVGNLLDEFEEHTRQID